MYSRPATKSFEIGSWEGAGGERLPSGKFQKRVQKLRNPDLEAKFEDNLCTWLQSAGV